MDLYLLRNHIACLRSIDHLQQITKGFSTDGKYFVYDDSHSKPLYVLRTAPATQFHRKNQEFNIIDRVFHYGVLTSEPIEFGTIESLNICYMILRYVEGQDASEILPKLTSNEQYKIGVEAGKQLRLLNELEAPVCAGDWIMRRTAKYKRQINEYENCGVKIPKTNKIRTFIDENLKRMLNRPNRLQHDDFHTANLYNT